MTTGTVDEVVSGFWLSPEKNLCLEIHVSISNTMDKHRWPGQESTHLNMALNNAGKDKTSELSHGFTKPVASPLPPASRNQWLLSFALSGTAPDAVGLLNFKVCSLLELIILTFCNVVFVKCRGRRLEDKGRKLFHIRDL